jgi:23S rRNA pseudouridine1911/1915/1917 synthase
MANVERNGKVAITNYKTISESLSSLTVVECLIETGRTHQIRVHMASIGCPIAGDQVYGRQGADKKLPIVPQRQLLHAYKLELKHPVTRELIQFTSPIPEDFKPYCSL